MPTTYVYRRAGSDGARALADALGARRWRDTNTPLSQKVRQGDRVIAWGEAFSAPGVMVLNGAPIRNKFTDAETLRAAGVSTIEVARVRPVVAARPAGPDPAIRLWTTAADLAEDFINDDIGEVEVNRSAPRLRGVDELVQSLAALQVALRNPVQVAAPAPDVNWLGRATDHTGGLDLLRNNATDFFVRKEELVREYRVHSFLNRSLRAGMKVLREGWTQGRTEADYNAGRQVAHPWVRSWDAGWRISYDGVSLNGKNAVRELAHSAIRALGLDFGAVDIGERADGTFVVLEVNRAPGIEAGTLEAYVNAINRWISGEWTADNRQERAPRRRAA